LALKQDFLAVPVDRPSRPVSGLPTFRPLADERAGHRWFHGGVFQDLSIPGAAANFRIRRFTGGLRL
jgi:hypothetical protein